MKCIKDNDDWMFGAWFDNVSINIFIGPYWIFHYFDE